MKSFLIAIIGLIIALSPAWAQEEEELIPDEPREAKEVIPDTIKKKINYDAIAIGGFGCTYMVNGNNSFTPTITLGFELPLNDRHNTSFQIYSFICAAKNVYHDGNVNSVNDLYYSYGISGILKLYILNLDSDFRMSLHFGASIIYIESLYPSFDLGLAGYYRISKNISLSLDSRYNSLLLGLGYGIPFGPIITSLNMYYYFEW